jgi:50S ribosomal subunit-associated GTPase HflX
MSKSEFMLMDLEKPDKEYYLILNKIDKIRTSINSKSLLDSKDLKAYLIFLVNIDTKNYPGLGILVLQLKKVIQTKLLHLSFDTTKHYDHEKKVSYLNKNDKFIYNKQTNICNYK